MTINISFAEIGKFVAEHYGASVELSLAGEGELRIAYVQRALLGSIRVPVTLRMDGVREDAVGVTYSGPLGLDKLVAGALAFLKFKNPELKEALVNDGNNHITVELSRLSRMRGVLEKLILRDITVAADSLRIEVDLK